MLNTGSFPVSFYHSKEPRKIARQYLNDNPVESGLLDHTSRMILTGDRISCCDEIIYAMEGYQEKLLLGVCTLSSQGEGYDHEPTIVARSVGKIYRGMGIGLELYRRAIVRMLERRDAGEFSEWNVDPTAIKIRVDHISEIDKFSLDKLLVEYPEYEGVLRRLNMYIPGLRLM